jgi:hypothetical protein
MDSAAAPEKRGRKHSHTRDSWIARNGCQKNSPPPLASSAPSSPAAVEATAGLVVLGRTTGERVVRLPLSNQQRATVSSTSTTAVAAASTATATSAAATLLSSGLDFGGHEDASDDSDYCVIVQSGNPSLTPLLCRVHRRMLNKLVKRTMEDNVQLSSSATMRMMIESVVEKHAYLLGLASRVDKTIVFSADQQTIYNMLSSTIPQRIFAKTTKSKIFKLIVDVWNILHILLLLRKLGRAEEHNLQSYLQLLDMIEKSCHWELAEAGNKNRNVKSVKILQQERERNFKELCGFGVDSCRFPGCAKCGHTLIDKPYSNKAKVKQNTEIQTKWKSNWGAVDNFLKGDGPLVVINGKNVTKIPNPTYKSEILVCHCWQNCASKFVGGQKCAWNCIVDGMQYNVGKCLLCLCTCSFICSKE